MIDYPVRLTGDFQIVDKFNRTVIPDLTWKGDLDHRKKQQAVGELIVGLLNDNYLASQIQIEAQEQFEKDQKPLLVKRGRGRPRLT